MVKIIKALTLLSMCPTWAPFPAPQMASQGLPGLILEFRVRSMCSTSLGCSSKTNRGRRDITVVGLLPCTQWTRRDPVQFLVSHVVTQSFRDDS